MKSRIIVLVLSIAVLMVSLSLRAGDLTMIPVGKKLKTEGVIIETSKEGFRIRNHAGEEIQILLGEWSDIREKHRNFLRYPDAYSAGDLIPGLNLRVEGHGDASGALLGEKIRFTRDELKVAQTISSSLDPTEEQLRVVENRLQGNERRNRHRFDQLDRKSQRIDGEVGELNAAFRMAREEARQAGLKADGALTRIEMTENRILDLDNYQELTTLDLNFDFNSAQLTDRAKLNLDEAVKALAGLEGYLIEVVGYASSDGDAEYNRKLSRQRAEAVTHYLVEEHSVPLWRLIQPYGFGELHPVGDNSTRQGRERNRRVVVRLLQSRGVAGTATAAQSGSDAVSKTSSR